MSGPALNPIANIAPPTPAGTAASARNDSPRAADDAAGGKGDDFAKELRRKVDAHDDARQPESGKPAREEAAATDEKAAQGAPAVTDPAAAALLTPPPELAILIAGTQTTATDAAGSGGKDLRRTHAEALSTDTPPDAFSAAALALAGSPQENAAGTPRGITLTADEHAPAKSAGTLADFAAKASSSEATALAGEAQRGLVSGADQAAANSFSSLHAAALAQMKGQAPQAASAPLSLAVNTPVNHPGWPEEVGNRVTWMVGHDESHAELTLSPPQLGKVEISLTINGDQTSAQFVAATPAARELIEQALPKLREILGESGITLGQTDVGTSSQSGDGDGRRPGSRWGSGRGDGSAVGTASSTGAWLRRGEGLVDTFA